MVGFKTFWRPVLPFFKIVNRYLYVIVKNIRSIKIDFYYCFEPIKCILKKKILKPAES